MGTFARVFGPVISLIPSVQHRHTLIQMIVVHGRVHGHGQTMGEVVVNLVVTWLLRRYCMRAASGSPMLICGTG